MSKEYENAELAQRNLFHACTDGNAELVLKLLASNPKDYSSISNIDGQTLLHVAIQSKQTNVCRILLCSTFLTLNGHYLMLAAKSGVREIVELVIPRVNSPLRSHIIRMCLDCAISNGYRDIVQLLLESGMACSIQLPRLATLISHSMSSKRRTYPVQV
jgi:ankyrin repeat protein